MEGASETHTHRHVHSVTPRETHAETLTYTHKQREARSKTQTETHADIYTYTHKGTHRDPQTENTQRGQHLDTHGYTDAQHIHRLTH